MIYQSFVFEPLYDIVLLINIIFLVNFMTEKEIAMAIKDEQSMIIANSFGQEVRVECKEVKGKGRFVCVELINRDGNGDSLCGFLPIGVFSFFYDGFKNCKQPMVCDHSFTNSELGAFFDTI